jgi:hypothetical protein
MCKTLLSLSCNSCSWSSSSSCAAEALLCHVLKLVGSVYRRWEVCPQYSPYVCYQSHNLVCLISDFRFVQGLCTCSGIAHRCILAPLLSTRTIVDFYYSTAYLAVLYFSTAYLLVLFYSHEYTIVRLHVLRSMLLHRVLWPWEAP